MKTRGLFALAAGLLLATQVRAQVAVEKPYAGSVPSFSLLGRSEQDRSPLEGVWVVVAKFTAGGNRIEPDERAKERMESIKLVFAGGKLVLHESSRGEQTTRTLGGYKISPDEKDGIDLVPGDGPHKGKTLPGIYELKADTLRICFTSDSRQPFRRPIGYTGSNALELKRERGEVSGSQQPCAEKKPGESDALAQDRKQLQGTWVIDFGQYKAADDQEFDRLRQLTLTFTDDKLAIRTNRRTEEATFTLGPAGDSQPRAIDLVPVTSDDKGKKVLGIYYVERDRLRLEWGRPGGLRPGYFGKGEGYWFRRQRGDASKGFDKHLSPELPAKENKTNASERGNDFTGPEQTPPIERISPPEAGFYGKKLDSYDIAIKAHAAVSDAALRAGHVRLEMMLKNLPTVRRNLAEQGVELHILGKDQVPSDLPEHRHLRGKPFDGTLTIDERTRGVGGLYASCGEENLLRLPGDRYAGRDICVHEFAHTIQLYGLSDELRTKIRAQYDRSLENGKWKTAYAATNDGEFFAELSMWYFGTHGDLGKLSPAPEPGREGLRKYDPDAFDLIDGIYSGHSVVVPLLTLETLTAAPAQREANLRSLESTQATTVLFHNRTSEELKLYWLDYQGKRQAYGSVLPHLSRSQQTFATHVWLVSDPKDRVIGIYVANRAPGKVVIQGANP